MVTGLFASGKMALRVLQQPVEDGNYIYPEDQTVTQFRRPGQFGVTGLLAHNTLSGQLFFYLKTQDALYLVFGDGHTQQFRISSIQRYQALSPTDPFSDFVDLNNASRAVINNETLFQRVYTTSGQLVLQTCFAQNGDLSFGRIFIIANPAN